MHFDDVLLFVVGRNDDAQLLAHRRVYFAAGCDSGRVRLPRTSRCSSIQERTSRTTRASVLRLVPAEIAATLRESPMKIRRSTLAVSGTWAMGTHARSPGGRSRSAPGARRRRRCRRRRCRPGRPSTRAWPFAARAGRRGRRRAGRRAPACPAAEANIAQRAGRSMPGHPERHDALVDLAHLPGAGQDAAAVDDRAHSIGMNIFLNQKLARQLARPVERPGASSGKSSAMPCSEKPRGHPGGITQRNASRLPAGERIQRPDRIDPAGAEEQEGRAPRLAASRQWIVPVEVDVQDLVRRAVLSPPGRKARRSSRSSGRIPGARRDRRGSGCRRGLNSTPACLSRDRAARCRGA